jgi:hypothetical protein
MSINTITLVGRAGRDPETRFFESGSVVSNLTLAVNRPSREEEEPDWFTLEIWGKQAQVAADDADQRALDRPQHWRAAQQAGGEGGAAGAARKQGRQPPNPAARLC